MQSCNRDKLLTNKLAINLRNPALFKVSGSKAVTDSQGDIIPNNRGLRTNSKLIPEGHFMQVKTRTSGIIMKIMIKVEEQGMRGR